jgi:hypothetical protein
MSHHPHNRLRQLQGLVTIDAWHEGHPYAGHVDLHAYVHFDEARLGGQSGDEIAFRLQLKRAELKLLQSEPKSFAIDPANIWRGDQDTSGKVIHTVEVGGSRSSDATASVNIGSSPELALKGGGKTTTQFSEKTETTSERSTKSICVSFRRNDKDQPAWILQPDVNAPKLNDVLLLRGQPWDDKQQRLLLMYVNAKHETQEMTAALRLCIICKREDLYFYDIMTRKSNEEFLPVPDVSTKRLVIQEYLRDALVAEGLPVGDMNSPFSAVYLGEAISEQRRPHANG